MIYKKKSHKVSIVMGSQSDYKTMKNCEKVLKILKVNYETNIVSAHRTPDRLYTYAKKAENNNISIIIAGAGGSAHLPGMIAAITRIPVIGVPIESKKLKGLDINYFGFFFTFDVCFFRQFKSVFFTLLSYVAIIEAAYKPALIAPSSPIATVPTGIPFGI